MTLAWQRAIRAALAPHDLTHTQFVLLTSLWWAGTHDGRAPTQRELAELAGTDAMMTSQVVRRLADLGLVTRTADKRDARARRLRITAAGAELVAGSIRDVEATDARFFAGIASAGERDAFLEVLRMLAGLPTAP